MSDDPLLRPTIVARPTGAPPWRPSSQWPVAFFGGSIAVTAIALINASRLGMPVRLRWIVGGVGAGALVTALVLAAALIDPDHGVPGAILGRVLALLAYLVQVRLQGPFFRGHELRGGHVASLWAPGLLAVIAAGLLEGGLLVLWAGS